MENILRKFLVKFRRVRVKAWNEHHCLRRGAWMPTIDAILEDLCK